MPAASLNYLLTSHVWRQDHNGFSTRTRNSSIMWRTRKPIWCASICRRRKLLAIGADHCLRSRNYVDLIIAGKQPEWQWLKFDSAVRHCRAAGAGYSRPRSETVREYSHQQFQFALRGAGPPVARKRTDRSAHTRALVLWGVARQSWETLAPDWEPVELIPSQRKMYLIGPWTDARWSVAFGSSRT